MSELTPKDRERCAYQYKLDGVVVDECIYDHPDYGLFEHEGRKYCRFHLPLGTRPEHDHEKNPDGHSPESWEEYCERFNESVFREVHFAAEHDDDRVVNLRGVVFPGYVDFTACRTTADVHLALDDACFHGDVAFDGYKFSNGASFRRAAFERQSSFDGCPFGAVADFFESRFAGVASFCKATFRGGAIFTRARFGGEAIFDGSLFEETAKSGPRFLFLSDVGRTGVADFRGAQFNFGALFSRTRFAGDARFNGCLFRRTTRFEKALFEGDAHFPAIWHADYESSWGHPSPERVYHEVMQDTSFSGAVFRASADFRARRLEGVTEFRAVDFASAPTFFGATFDRSTTFSRCSFRLASRETANEAVNAYRYLKTAMDTAGADLPQSKFYAEEQKALLRTTDLTTVEKALSVLYWLCADYGHRAGRPLLVFVLANLVFMIVYSVSLPADAGGSLSIVVQFGVEQIVRPFSVWVAGYESPYLEFVSPWFARWTATLQSTISLSLVGLFFVSIHRHFRMR